MQYQFPPYSWISSKVELFTSPIDHWGISASDVIEKGEVIRIWGGILIPETKIGIGQINSTSFIAADEEDGILYYLKTPPEELKNNHPANYGNHSCEPNMWLDGPNKWIALRRILSGEEICSDYALFTADPVWKMLCKCNTSKCRKIITGKDWEKKELQVRYSGHFSPFITRRIKKKGTI